MRKSYHGRERVARSQLETIWEKAAEAGNEQKDPNRDGRPSCRPGQIQDCPV